MRSSVDKDWAKQNTEFREIRLLSSLQEEEMKSAVASKTTMIYGVSTDNRVPCPTLPEPASLSPSCLYFELPSSADKTHSSVC